MTAETKASTTVEMCRVTKYTSKGKQLSSDYFDRDSYIVTHANNASLDWVAAIMLASCNYSGLVHLQFYGKDSKPLGCRFARFVTLGEEYVIGTAESLFDYPDIDETLLGQYPRRPKVDAAYLRYIRYPESVEVRHG